MAIRPALSAAVSLLVISTLLAVPAHAAALSVWVQSAAERAFSSTVRPSGDSSSVRALGGPWRERGRADPGQVGHAADRCPGHGRRAERPLGRGDPRVGRHRQA
ncbi:hypothetical protein [Nonomuraea dietziae]|uniref:hypothetical protein n=1 Tax=Nonomuraea dietziae TaxID=65515 RepID=UPI0031E188AC